MGSVWHAARDRGRRLRARVIAAASAALFVLALEPASAAAQATTTTTTQDAPWEILWVFGGLLVGLSAIAALALVAGKHSPADALKNLGLTYSWKDSWASNATVGAAVITGFLSSATPVKSFLGENAEASLAVAVVGAAIGVALIAAGAIVLAATRRNVDGYFTVGGFYGAVCVALAGAIGQVVVAAFAASKFTGGIVEAAVWVAAGATTALLAVYGYRSSTQVVAKKNGSPAGFAPGALAERSALP